MPRKGLPDEEVWDHDKFLSLLSERVRLSGANTETAND
jgi:hypothetical protein